MSILKVSITQIKAARALLGWSQEDLAKEAAVSVPTVKRLEAGEGELGGRSETVVNCEQLWRVQESNLSGELAALVCGSVNERQPAHEKAYFRFIAKVGRTRRSTTQALLAKKMILHEHQLPSRLR
jgi:transcriptional regulator with XRE-family HTH domain